VQCTGFIMVRPDRAHSCIGITVVTVVGDEAVSLCNVVTIKSCMGGVEVAHMPW
jgi:hypothetical protein